MRSVGRTLRLFGVILGACLELMRKRPRSRRDGALWLHGLCRRALETFGVEMEVTGAFPERGVLISNHLSYLDILVFAALRPCVFVSKAEIRGWPVIGWMTTTAGTVYVERGKGGSARSAGANMVEAAREGLPVVFFPEGTTSDGTGVLKFHRGLLGEALGSGQPVTAAYLSYSVGGGRGSEEVAYWGDQSMPTHVFRFLGLRDVVARVHFSQGPIPFAEGTAGRKTAAVEARCAVLELRRVAEAGRGLREEECEPAVSERS